MDARDKRWIDAAIGSELKNIEALSSLPKPPKLQKPDSPITLSMLKIASIVNGYQLSAATYYREVLFALRCHPDSRKPRRIEYQWRRMVKRARPRRRTMR